MTGLDTASAFDLPYAVDESTLPPPPDARPAPPAYPTAATAAPAATAPAASASSASTHVAPEPAAARARRPLPSTFSTPEPPADTYALPPSPAATRRTPPPAMPAPLAAGPLSGFDDDVYDRIAAIAADPAFADPVPDPVADAPVALPPMVAKGTWDTADAGRRTASEPTAPPPAPPEASPTAAVEVAPPPIDKGPSRGSFPWSSTVPPATAAPPPPSTPALAFSPDAELPGPPPPLPTGPTGSHESPGPRSGPLPPPLITSQQYTASIDRRTAGNQMVSTTRLADGILVSAAAAVVAGFVWWAVVAFTERQFVYLAVILGVLVGQAALVGGRRGSVGLGIVAASLTLLALTATQYFITRSLVIAEGAVDVPLWDGASRAVEVIRTTFEEDRVAGIFVVLATVAAGVQAGIPGKRASGPLGELRAPREPSRVL